MKRTILLVLVLAAGCATAPSPGEPQKPTIAASAEPVVKAAPSVTYYKGTMQVTSPDGAQPYGPAQTGLVKREVFPSEGRIVETTLDEGAMRATTLTLKDGNVFDATDAEGSFTGTVTFSPDPWNATSWTYDLTMADGSGKIVGTATIDSGSIKTEKFFVTAAGEKQARIVDDLSTVTAEEFAAAAPK